jgi:hypothetical protein
MMRGRALPVPWLGGPRRCGLLAVAASTTYPCGPATLTQQREGWNRPGPPSIGPDGGVAQLVRAAES